MSHLHLQPTGGGSIQPDLERQHRESWERGQVDYLGQDKFENIAERMESFVGEYKDTTYVPVLI